ncbi:MAG: hypothetical protein K1Y01_18800 [Vicinamibacteria bacterium]|nr:hypothetical protein [Vicinamibacteria bacterium]
MPSNNAMQLTERECWADVARLRVLVLLPVLVLLFSLASLADEGPPTRRFDRIIQPAGWALPPHGKRLRSGVFKGQADGITFVAFKGSSKKTFSLPHPSLEDGSLVWSSQVYYADEVTRLEARGKPYAWGMLALGAYVGCGAEVFFVDRDGDGRFEELDWYELGKLPDWVTKRLAEPAVSQAGR